MELLLILTSSTTLWKVQIFCQKIGSLAYGSYWVLVLLVFGFGVGFACSEREQMKSEIKKM